MKKIIDFKHLRLILLFFVTLTLTNCESEEDVTGNDEDLTGNPVETVAGNVKLDEPDGIAKAIEVVGATEVPGNPPAPSTDPNTPVITNDALEIVSGQTGSTTINISVDTPISGFYFQVNGATSYLNIPLSPNGARIIQDSTSTSFNLGLADAFEPGTFCGILCVYDAEERVSAPIDVCIEILALGGEGSAFLIGSWSLLSEESDGITTSVGENSTNTEQFYCDTLRSVEYIETSRIEFMTAVFNNLGEITLDGEEFESELLHEESTCDQLTYEESIYAIEAEGIWTFDNALGELNMVLTFADDEGPEPTRFKVERIGDNVKLTFLDGDDDGSLLFAPKK